MTSEEMRLAIPQYLSAQLSVAERSSFEEALRDSPELRIELGELRALWDELGALPQEEPSPALRAHFYQRLNDVKNGRRQPANSGFAWWKPGLAGLVRQGAVAVLVFSLGLFVGREKRSPNAPAETAGTSKAEVKRLDTEVQRLRQTVALSLLDRQSATSRLEGISWSSQVDRPDQDLVAALEAVLNQDANINVRLSALDALGKFSDDAKVRRALVAAIPKQDSPLVQIALIDALVHIKDSGAKTELRKLSRDTEVNSVVRQRAEWGLQKLSYQ